MKSKIQEIINKLDEEIDTSTVEYNIFTTRNSLLEILTKDTTLKISVSFISGISIYNEDYFSELIWLEGGGVTLTQFSLPKDVVNFYIDISPFKINDKFIYFVISYLNKIEVIYNIEDNKFIVRNEEEMFTDNAISIAKEFDINIINNILEY